MKGQQLFNSFCLASTTAVLATQPVWAETVQVSAVQLKPVGSDLDLVLNTTSSTSPQVFTFNNGRTFNADIVNTQLRNSLGNTFHASNPTHGITDVTVAPLNAKSIRVTVTGKTGVPVGKMVRSDKGLVLNLTTSNQKASRKQGAGSRGQQTSGLKPSKSIISQQPTSPVTPSPANSNIRTQRTPTPSYLNPSPNPLQFPTRPEEVRIQGIQPITLQQAFELARRNNRQLQVAELTVQRSRAAVREAQAALYPTLGVGLGVENGPNNNFGTGFGTGLGGGLVNTSTGQINPTTGQVNPTTGQIDPATGQVNTTTGQIDPATGQVNTTTGQIDPATGQATTGTTGQAATGTTGATTGLTQQNNRERATSLTGTVQLSYNLYNSGIRRARIRAAEEQLRIDELDFERLSEQLRLDVSNDYFDLQAGDEQVRINQAAVTNAEASLRDAQALEQAGVGTRFAVLQSQVQVANATQELTNSVSQQQIARRQLAQRLSLAQSISITAADPVEIAGLWNPTLEESIVLAFQNRAELQQQLAQRNISEQLRRAALGELGPQVDLTANYIAGNTDIFDDDNDDFEDQYTLGAQASLTLFDGGAARSRAAQEEANIAIAETNFADQSNLIRFEVEQAYSQLQSNLANIQTASVGLEQAREALRLARLRFQAGVGTQTDVIDAEDELTQAEGNRVNAILGYNRSLANLQRAISSGQPR